MMKRVMRVVIPLTLLLLAACGGGTHDSGASGGGASGGSASGGGASGGGTPGGGGSGGGTTVPPAATAPTISTQPASQNVTAPAAATFSVAAGGTDPLSYQWRSSANGAEWTNIGGATGATYDVGTTDVSMNGRYYSVVVSNSAGSVTSAAVQLTVAAPPSGGGGDGGGDSGTPPSDGSLQPLTGAADPFPHTVAPLAATPASGSMQNRSIISWDPHAAGFNLGLIHYSGAETRLFLPGGVFRDEVFLTLTEITGIGPQVTAVLAAVRIEPGDLLAEKTITATFTIPDAVMATVDVNQMIGFAADSDGSNLHLMPIVPGTLGTAAARPGIKLGHLGIVGIALATPSQQAALAAAWPADPDDQLDAAVAPAATAKWRASVQPLASSTSNGRLKIQAVDPSESPLLAPLRGYFNESVVPAFAAAYGDPEQIPAAIQTGLTFIRNATLSGLADADGPLAGVVADLNGRIDTLVDTYADYVAEQCKTLGGPPQMQAMLGVLRALQLAGHDSKSDEIDDILAQCSHFKATFRHEYTRTGHWETGGTTIDESVHTVVEGSTTFGLNQATEVSPLRLTTAELDRTDSGGGSSTHTTWAPEADTSPWGVYNLSVPVVRTKSGVGSSSVEMTLHAFDDIPLQATVTTTTSTTHFDTPDVTVSIPLFVPVLPKIGGTAANYGPMLIPQSGSATSQATRTIPEPNGGSATERESVTVTMSRAE